VKFNRYKKDGGSGGSKHILKIAPGKDVRLVCRGEVKEYNQHWPQGQSRSVLCSEDASCQLCRDGDKPSFRFRVNCVVNENGAYVAKILEQGWKLYCQLGALSEAGYDLDKTVIKISRQGENKNNTVYTAVALPGNLGTVTPEQAKLFAAIPLISLSGDEQDEPEQDAGESDLPF